MVPWRSRIACATSSSVSVVLIASTLETRARAANRISARARYRPPSRPIRLPGRPRGPTLTGSPARWAAGGPRPAAEPERGHRERTDRTPRGRRALARRRPSPPLAAARRRGLDTGAPRRPPPGTAPRDAAGRGGLRRRPPAAAAPPRGVPAPPRRGRTHRLRRGLPGGRLGLRRPAGPADRAGREP